MTAIGLGCNKKQMTRASNLALAYTAVRYFPPQDLGMLTPDLRALSGIQPHRVVIRGVGMQMSKPMGLAPWTSTPEGDTGAQVAPSECLVPMPFSSSNRKRRVDIIVHPAPRSSPGSPEDIQDQVRSAKSHLCAFRKLMPILTDAQNEAVQLLLKEIPLKAMSFEHASAFGYHSWVLGKLKQVQDDDRWKSNHCGKVWVSDWLNWGPNFTDPATLGKNDYMRRINSLWFHVRYDEEEDAKSDDGCSTCTTETAPPSVCMSGTRRSTENGDQP